MLCGDNFYFQHHFTVMYVNHVFCMDVHIGYVYVVGYARLCCVRIRGMLWLSPLRIPMHSQDINNWIGYQLFSLSLSLTLSLLICLSVYLFVSCRLPGEKSQFVTRSDVILSLVGQTNSSAPRFQHCRARVKPLDYSWEFGEGRSPLPHCGNRKCAFLSPIRAPSWGRTFLGLELFVPLFLCFVFKKSIISRLNYWFSSRSGSNVNVHGCRSTVTLEY